MRVTSEDDERVHSAAVSEWLRSSIKEGSEINMQAQQGSTRFIIALAPG
jgi:hypothetical protein